MTLTLHIEVEAAGWREALGDPEELARSAIEAALATEPALLDATHSGIEIGIRFADDPTVHALNRDWRGKDKPTNVLSFPLDREAPAPDAPLLLGDLVLAFETTSREATEKSIPLRDHALHLLVHGTLHLIGHDHEEAEEAEAMERLETNILARMGVPDPYHAA